VKSFPTHHTIELPQKFTLQVKQEILLLGDLQSFTQE